MTDYSDCLEAPRKDKKYLSWIHELQCPVTGREGEGVQAAHVRMGDMSYGKLQSGKAQKPDDYFCLPLWHEEHARQHSMNEEAYWRQVGIDPLLLCCKLRMVYPNTDKARVVIRWAAEQAI